MLVFFVLNVIFVHQNVTFAKRLFIYWHSYVCNACVTTLQHIGFNVFCRNYQIGYAEAVDKNIEKYIGADFNE